MGGGDAGLPRPFVLEQRCSPLVRVKPPRFGSAGPYPALALVPPGQATEEVAQAGAGTDAAPLGAGGQRGMG